MMQKRSQMRWELWHYNWEKMVSDSLIKLTAGLASCLIAGSPDFAVGKFLGSPGGGVDICCRTSFGEEICAGDLTDFASTTTGTGKDKETSNHAIDALRMVCPANAEFYPTQASRKSALDVRLRCLGLKLSELKNMTQVRRSAVCVNMYGDPMQVNISVKRNNKERVKQYRKMGYYVMGKKGNDECAVAINHAIPGINDIPYQKGMTKVVVYRVGATGAGFFPEGNDDPTFDRDLEDYKNKKGNYNSEEEIYWESGDYYRGLREAEQKIQNAIDRGECLSEKRVQEILKTYGKWRDSSNSMGRFNTVATCGVPANRFGNGTISPLRINTKDGTTSMNSSPYSGIVCDKTTAFIPNAGGWHAISATIKNPGPRTIAVVMEEVQGGETAGTGYFKNGDQTTIPERSGFLIKEVIDFSRETEGQKRSTTKKDENGNEYTETAFIGEFKVGLSSTIKDDAKGSRVLARSGKGYVLWITTDDLTSDIKNRNTPVYDTDLQSVMNTLPNKGYATGICKYIWGCGETDDCLDINKNYCRDAADGKIYKAVEYRGYLFRASRDPIEDQNVAYEVLQCEPVCQYKNGGASIVNETGSAEPIPNIAPLTKEELQAHGIYVENCPFCNPSEPKNKPAGDGQCYIEDKYNVKHCYPSITLESHRLHYNIRISEEEITPCNAENPCWSICADKAKVIYQAIRNADDTTYDRWGDEPLTENPDDILPVKPGDPLCPYCNPNPEDDGAGKCYIGKQIYPSTSFVGIDGRTYHIRTSQTFTSGQASYPCTPICAAKAKALGMGIFETEGIDSEAPVDPDSPLTRNEGDINPVKPGTPLCPYCNPDPSEEPAQPEYTDIVIGPCEVQLIGEFFWNASYELKKQLPLAKIYEVMHDCDNPIIEGHASKTTVTDDKGQVKNNNKRLSFDRAMEVSRQVQKEWASHGVDLQVTPTSDGLGNYQGIAPDSRWVKYRSWPKRRNTISNPSNPAESVTIYGVGDRDAVFQRPPLPAGKKAWPAADEANYRLQESKDRKVIIKGTVRR
ncbi:MAG: hypothetical protein IKP23_00735 [Elusimicrobiaceae bacterium]|nr:hypothetical protein [Elusimicrobiaceae bacterium]